MAAAFGLSPCRKPRGDYQRSKCEQVNSITNKNPVKRKMIQSRDCLSDVDVRLSQVHVLFSEINQMMSKCPIPVKSRKLLPRLDDILSEISSLVSLSQECFSDTDVDGEGEECPDASLDWDNYNHSNYYYLYNDDYYNNNQKYPFLDDYDEDDVIPDDNDVVDKIPDDHDEVDDIPYDQEEVDTIPDHHDEVDIIPDAHDDEDDNIEDDDERHLDCIADRVKRHRNTMLCLAC